jgi:hypothetical protein
MGESIQRLLKRRTLDGQTPTMPEQNIQWFQATAPAWNADPTPFEWNGKCKRRRQWSPRHAICPSFFTGDKWRCAHELTYYGFGVSAETPRNVVLSTLITGPRKDC